MEIGAWRTAQVAERGSAPLLLPAECTTPRPTTGAMIYGSRPLAALGAEVAAGTIGLTGASNHATWRLEQARGLSEAQGLPRYRVLQLRYSYLQPRLDIPLPETAHQHATLDNAG